MFFDERIRIRTSDLIRVGNKKKHPKKTPKNPLKMYFWVRESGTKMGT